jgi:hypothetical protein
MTRADLVLGYLARRRRLRAAMLEALTLLGRWP